MTLQFRDRSAGINPRWQDVPHWWDIREKLENNTEYKTYGSAHIILKAGCYTRKDVEEMLEHFNQMDRQLDAAMTETPKHVCGTLGFGIAHPKQEGHSYCQICGEPL